MRHIFAAITINRAASTSTSSGIVMAGIYNIQREITRKMVSLSLWTLNDAKLVR